MKTSDIRKKSVEELHKALRDAQAQMVDLRFSIAAGNTKGISELRRTRRGIARIYTILREAIK